MASPSRFAPDTSSILFLRVGQREGGRVPFQRTHLPRITTDRCRRVRIYDGATRGISTMGYSARFTTLHDCPLTSRKMFRSLLAYTPGEEGSPREKRKSERETGLKVVRPDKGSSALPGADATYKNATMIRTRTRMRAIAILKRL